MPTFRKGEMFRAPGLIIVTTNSFLTSEVKLVMGRGAAWQLKKRVPGIDTLFGKMIHDSCGHLGCYGLIFHGRYGAAQVKYRFNEKARLELIRLSMNMLSVKASRDRKSIFKINFPGIGNGGLKRDQVESLLKVLPDNVHVWEKEGGMVDGLYAGTQSEIVLYSQENRVGVRSAYDESDRQGLRAYSGDPG
jgi:hypothetical protein